MKVFSPLWARLTRARRPGLLGALALLWLLILLPGVSRASHIRAGDIQARIDTSANPNPRRVFFKLTLYTDRIGSPPNPVVKQDAVQIYFGDGTTTGGSPGVARSTPSPVQVTSDTDVNVYYFEHTYSSNGTFVVSFIGENRNDGVRNMSNSSQQSFYISTRITIDPALGGNHSPVLLAPAYDKAAVAQVFLHNPAAYDADGDSLAFKLRPCQQVPGGTGAVPPTNRPAPQTCTGYVYPNQAPSSAMQVAYGGVPFGMPGRPAIFVQDVRTGQLTWNAPASTGYYNAAFVVEEWRRGPFGPRLIGEVIRDMQIIVTATNNLRPTITVPADICVEANQPVRGVVTATDVSGSGSGGEARPITLFAYAGILPPATFVQSQTGPPTAQAVFQWTPDCSRISKQPYQVLFKAQDNPTGGEPPLTDEGTWNITVVGPAPRNLQVLPQASSTGPTAVLTWDAYVCGNASRLLIFRKEGSGNFTPGPCITGIPATAGYTQIGSVSASTRSFVDPGNPVLERGKAYCYRIYAQFANGAESIASQEVCLTLDGRPAQLTNVDVNRTDAVNGQITVRWTRPVPGRGQLPYGSPSGYRLLRAPGLNPTTGYTLATTKTSLADTMFVDQGLNTQTTPYTYKVEFFSPGTGSSPVVETSAPASSVRVATVPDSRAGTITVSWNFQVPWDNTAQPTVIFRRSPGSSTFVRLDSVSSTATGGSYVDRDRTLVRDQTYCYYVQTRGRYPNIPYLSRLINNSQEQCVVLASEPCSPVLTVLPINCDSLKALPLFPAPNQRYDNRLRWTLGSEPAGCNRDVSYYRVLYRPSPGAPLTRLDSTQALSYVHRNLSTPVYCYVVQAVVTGASSSSNEACQTGCSFAGLPGNPGNPNDPNDPNSQIYFELPNIFTPNGDGFNDTFRPRRSTPLKRVHFQAFNRWGVKVFEGDQDPLINWDGSTSIGETNRGAKLSGGVYYYLAEVEFADFANTKRTYKGWVEIVR